MGRQAKRPKTEMIEGFLTNNHTQKEMAGQEGKRPCGRKKALSGRRGVKSFRGGDEFLPKKKKMMYP